MKFIYSALLVLLTVTVRGNDDFTELISESNEKYTNDVGIENRIYNGISASWNQFNYVARLQIFFKWNDVHLCSGVVINTRSILTVAHCVKSNGSVAKKVSARLPSGGWYFFTENEIIVHPLNSGYAANIAILRKGTVNPNYLRNFGTPPELPPNSGTLNCDPSNSCEVTIAGWGKTKNPFYPSRVQYGRVAFEDTQLCQQEFPKLNLVMNPDELMCTINNINGLCEGDWGGPLLVRTNNIVYLGGLNMYKEGGCANNGSRLSAYMNVSTVADWIRMTLVQNT